jgi:hypothetical protein
MNPNPPSERCEASSREISAFVDGELPFPESLAVVDHVASCEACRRFYLDSRRLSERLAEAPAAPAPDAVWERLAGSASPSPARRRLGPRRLRSLGLAAAAVLVAALGVARLRSPAPPPAADSAASTSPLREIVVEGARGRMTDERFLALLSELLSADSRYHKETERVLGFVLRHEGAGEPETLPGSLSEDSEAGDAEAGARQPRPGARRAAPLPS